MTETRQISWLNLFCQSTVKKQIVVKQMLTTYIIIKFNLFKQK